ncbi:hypothetical protein Y032_0137g2000 [Ancylostoma ceylanicum]|uniref:Uncharacterized protein n=1 Tax=Ancylostoma ceylanicum TaxID=53326 RepID=A0A016T4T8_9BILA|nr:hypothetical protein Y032_0137g2000 [Ancylostoma ceylanicum]
MESSAARRGTKAAPTRWTVKHAASSAHVRSWARIQYILSRRINALKRICYLYSFELSTNYSIFISCFLSPKHHNATRTEHVDVSVMPIE